MSSFFVHMSKKISMPNDSELGCVAWDRSDGWVCCGGAAGLVRVLRLEPPDPETGKASISTFVLGGHLEKGFKVNACRWNEKHRKLTTCDDAGLIIVWVLHKGQWHEEMLNNRQKSTVSDLRWAPDASKICIAYQDGAVIVGKVDGTRIWGKELGMTLDKLVWSPDCQNIIFSNREGQLFLYDSDGNQISRLELACTHDKGSSTVAGLEWFDKATGEGSEARKTLAVGLVNGLLQLMSAQIDPQPIIIDTGMRLQHLAWSPDGLLLAVAGNVHVSSQDQSEISVLRFYTEAGAYLRQMRIPRRGNLSGISWEGTGLRMAVAFDHMLYFVNIKPNYKWGHCGRTIVYAFARPKRNDHCIMFWDTTTFERSVKFSKTLKELAAYGQYCALLTRGDHPGKFVVIICNNIGSPIDSRHLHFEPTMITLTATHVVVASADVVCIWNFCTPQGKLTVLENPFALDTGITYEHIFHIKEGPHAHTGSIESYVIPDHINALPITAITANSNLALVARWDGASSAIVHKYSLPDLQQLAVIHVDSHHGIQRLWLNCNATMVAFLDQQGTLRVLDLTLPTANDPDTLGKLLEFEQKDVWDMRWADDIPDMMAVMEKGRLQVLRNFQPEAPIATDLYLISFGNLDVRMVDMDSVMSVPDAPEADLLALHETRSFTDTRDLLATDIQAAFDFVETSPHKRLWLLMAEAALVQLNFQLAIKAFVLKDDYKGVQYVKQVQALDDERKQRAEIAAYFRQFDEAENIYVSMGRTDLAINLHMRLGDWDRVKLLIETHKAGDDKLLAQVHENMGEVYMGRRRWEKAVRHFVQCKNSAKLADCFFEMEDYEDVEELVDALPEGNPLLQSIAERLESVGLCESAVKGYVKMGQVQRAIDCCSSLNQWDLACALAEEHNMHAENLLNKQAARLLSEGRKIDVIYLYKKARQHGKAASALVELAKKAKAEKAAPLRIKKLYVLAAFEVEKAREDVHMARGASSLTTLGLGAAAGPTYTAAGTRVNATLQGLVTLDAAAVQGEESMDRAWRGAEAYHFWMLIHRQLYAGDTKAALRTALNMRRYDDVLPVTDIYAMLALVAFNGGYFGQCSKAFMRLESLHSERPGECEALAELAMSIFAQQAPVDPDRIEEAREAPVEGNELAAMLQGLGSEKDLICVASGRVIRKTRDETRRCPRCRHMMIIAELKFWDARIQSERPLHHCPLCHCDLQ